MLLCLAGLCNDSFTACCRNNLHAAWRVGQTQKYDKMALQQAELQAVQRRGPVTARQQQMQEKAARKIDTLRGLSKDYALLDTQKQVGTRGPVEGAATTHSGVGETHMRHQVLSNTWSVRVAHNCLWQWVMELICKVCCQALSEATCI